MYTAGAQHSSSRLSLWRPAPQEKLLLCVNVAGPGWASPEKRSRPARGWKGRPRSWQRSARWYQPFCFFFAGARRSLVRHTKTKISRTHTDTDGFFFGDVPVSIRNSLRSNNIEKGVSRNERKRTRPKEKTHEKGTWKWNTRRTTKRRGKKRRIKKEKEKENGKGVRVVLC